ncbi:MAG TPA: AAA family ATPase [Candidatus Marinimicrobia bacterium]|jgi:chromosome partitioning protein|nr:AAA family ATPase [Candidatus Neomarinimicrobiota bacterium]|tara:strand:+ start:8293 stop:9057 length:765 start_codon:yes stop_codon:yes gene_type:complete
MTKILSLVNQKGGVGKTTSSVNIAVSMAAAEIRTLLIDFDPQANATTGVSNLIKKNNYTIYDVLMRGTDINKALISTKFDHLDVIISENDLVGAEIELVNVMAREYQLKSLIKKLKRKYEYIIVDCPPSLGLLTINALAASNAVLIPIQCEYYALEGLGQLLNTIRLVQKHINPKLSIAGVLLTMYDSRLNLSKEVADEVREYFEEKLFNTVIHRNVRLGEAPSFGKPALLYDANSTGAQNYLSLVEELLNRVK